MNKINNLLDEKGLSKTAVRTELLKSFFESKKSLSIYDFKKNPNLKKINESSIYRNLNRFEELGIIHSIQSPKGFSSYELLEKGDHHHHIVCGKCKVVQCLSACSIHKELEKITKKIGYLLDGHKLELFGTCENCQ